MNYLSLQLKLEKLYNKNQLINRVRSEFNEISELKAVMVEAGIPVQFGMDALVHISIHKQANLPTMVGLLNFHFKDVHKTAKMLEQVVMVDLISYDTTYEKFIVNYELSDELWDELNRYMYPPPMVIEPREVTNNSENGYYLTTGSLILKNNHHDDDICLDHINRINKIKYSVDVELAKNVKNHWKGIDKKKPSESLKQFNQRRKQFEKFNEIAIDYMQLVTELDNEIYFTHKYDKRGRTYCQGYHLNYQSNDWCKAVIHLANEELIK